jgi:hypothetical protein
MVACLTLYLGLSAHSISFAVKLASIFTRHTSLHPARALDADASRCACLQKEREEEENGLGAKASIYSRKRRWWWWW